MGLIVETGSGVPNANSYSDLLFARDYLTDRNDATNWIAATAEKQKAALIEATTYIDLSFGHRFHGVREHVDLQFFATGFIRFTFQAEVGDTVTIGDVTYSFVSSSPSGTQVLIGADIAASVVNLQSSVNGINADANVIIQSDSQMLLVMATGAGVAGNAVQLSASVAQVSGASLSGGRPIGVQPLEFPRKYLYDRRGFEVLGIPEKLKFATVEYANRAIIASLFVDPVYSDSGRVITRELSKVGPIEEEFEYLPGALTITRKFPAADKLLREYMGGAGGVIR